MREVHRSARRHGISDAAMLHADDRPLVAEQVGVEPARWLIVGPDASANLLEVVVLVAADGKEIVIHAMRLRRSTARKLLEP